MSLATELGSWLAWRSWRRRRHHGHLATRGCQRGLLASTRLLQHKDESMTAPHVCVCVCVCLCVCVPDKDLVNFHSARTGTKSNWQGTLGAQFLKSYNRPRAATKHVSFLVIMLLVTTVAKIVRLLGSSVASAA